MNRVTAGIALSCGLLWPPPAAVAADPPKPEIVAVVQKITGTVYWKQAKNTSAVRLDADKDRARRIAFGEWVEVAPGSALTIIDLRNKAFPVETLKTPPKGKAQWVTFPHLSSPEQQNLATVLQNLSELGGRKRAGGSIFFVPAQDSVVRPEHLVFRWNPLSVGSHVTLSISELLPTLPQGGNPIWHQEAVDPQSGHLDSEKAREALKRYRATGHYGKLTLAISANGKVSHEVYFTLLNPASEQDLKDQLALWERQQGLLRPLGRAYVFNSLDMFCEAANEYEAALSQAPQSTQLLLKAIVAQQQIGNRVREQALRKRLPPGTKVPGDLPTK